MKTEKIVITSATVILAAVLTALMSRPAGAQNSPPSGATQGSAPVSVVNQPIGVTGTVNVGNLGASTLPVSVTNFPATQSVAVTNFPATQTVSGTVNIGTLPAVQAIAANEPGSYPFSGSLTSASPQMAVPTTVSSRNVRALAVTEVSGSCTGIAWERWRRVSSRCSLNRHISLLLRATPLASPITSLPMDAVWISRATMSRSSAGL